MPQPPDPWEWCYPLCRRLGGSQGRCAWVQKISLPLGFVCWTVQPLASPYTDWAVPAHTTFLVQNIIEAHIMRYWCTQCCHKFCYKFHVVRSWRQWGRRVERMVFLDYCTFRYLCQCSCTCAFFRKTCTATRDKRPSYSFHYTSIKLGKFDPKLLFKLHKAI